MSAMRVTKIARRYRATIFLALALLLLGAVAALGALQLSQIISRQLRAETAAAICATLQRQQYDALARLIDPAPVLPLATGAFNARTFEAQLRALDQHQGVVNSCSWRPLQLDNESATYTFTLRRARIAAPIGMLVVMRREPDNGWRVSRSSAFTIAPV